MQGAVGLGTIVILGLIGWALGIDPSVLIGGAEVLNGGAPTSHQSPGSVRVEPNDELKHFVSAVVGDTEDRWSEIFKQNRQTYRAPKLRQEQSGCGLARAATGPFYCPEDQRVYLDTSFFNDLQRRFYGCSGKACEFSEAYVIAHEVGHHVQNLLGILPKARKSQEGQHRASGDPIFGNGMNFPVASMS
jgi:hypothetical protein